MSFTPMSIAGGWVYEPKVWPDERGTFHEVFKLSEISEQLGRDFVVKQVNQSTSHQGVIRGIHWADVPPGQAKYVSCSSGRIWDFVVDIRVGSPTFGAWEAVELSGQNRKSLLISEGLGHAFLSVEDGSTVNYLCSEQFKPGSEHSINPLDETLNICFNDYLPADSVINLSAKDANAWTLDEAYSRGNLPAFKQP